MVSIGDTLQERYRITEAIGQGGIASIFLAHDIMLDSKVAVKVLHPHLQRQKIIFERFKKEVSLTRQIEHDHIIKIYNLLESDDGQTVFLVMEFLPGGDLKKRILEMGALPVDDVITIGREILLGLGAAHRVGIIHRDIKPHNILFDAHGSSRITDFGLARSGELLGITTQTCVSGTPEYIAPEMLLSRHIDARADLYSVGITLFEAATGTLPFVSNSPYQTMLLQAEGQAPEPIHLNPSLPQGLSDVILKALEKDPGDRFQSAEEFYSALDTLTVPSLALTPATHECPQCGDPVLDVFPFCFACGREPLMLKQEKKKTGQWRVIVTGSGKAADRISHPERLICLDALSDTDVSTSRLDKKLPRLPFVLLDKLDETGARQLAEKLNGNGLDAVAVNRDNLKNDKQLVKKMSVKWHQMTRRYMAILATVSGGLWNIVFQHPQVFVPLVVTGLASIPIWCRTRYRMPEVQWLGEGNRQPAENLVSLARSLKNMTLRMMTRRILGKSEVLRLSVKNSSTIPDELQIDILEAVDLVLQQAVIWLEQANQMDVLAKQTDENVLYEEISRLDADLAFCDDAEVSEQMITKRNLLDEELDLKRNLEQTREVLFERLLTLSSRLDALAVRLATISSGQASEIVRNLSELTDDLTIATDTAESIENFLAGRDTELLFKDDGKE